MCFQCRALGAVAPLCVGAAIQPWLLRADFVPAALKPHLIDAAAEEYLAPTLEKFLKVANVRLRAIKVDSDGSCLPYAVSRCLVGMEVLYDVLRAMLVKELEDNKKWYQATFSQGMDEVEFEAHFRGLVEEAMPTHGQRTGRWLGPGEHLTAMANVLCRPILLLDADMSQPLVAGMHLPLRRSREDIVAAHPAGFPSPIVIGWASAAHNHFVSLIHVQQEDLVGFLTEQVPDAWKAVERRAYGTTGRQVTFDVMVPHNHRPGARCVLRDQELDQDMYVDVPGDKRPGDTFKANITRPVAPFEAALVLLCGGNGPTTLARALKTLSQVLVNLADASFTGNRDKMSKTGRLRLDNAQVFSNILSPPGALEVLQSCGFAKQGTELVFTGVVDEPFILARDALTALLARLPVVDGEVRAGMDQELFGPSPSVGTLSWEDARERYASDGSDAGKRAAELRRSEGVWTLGAGRTVRTEVSDQVTAMKRCFEELAAPTDVGRVDWDDDVAYDFRMKEANCGKCGALNLWNGPIDGPGAEAHEQKCTQCEAALQPELCGARRILHFVGQAAASVEKSGGGEFGLAGKCALCGRWRLSKLGCACEEPNESLPKATAAT